MALLAGATTGRAADRVAAGSGTPQGSYDLWIRNGAVIDGTGHARVAADVLVKGDTIAFVGKLASGQVSAHRIVDASGKIVAPGFIDAHSHGDPLVDSFMNFLAQGVTTVVLGQDGVTAGFDEDMPRATLAQWMRRVEKHKSEVNIAAMSGHGTLRILAGVDDTPQPSPSQLARMQKILLSDMSAGAFGLSFGLEYAPGRYAKIAEEKALGDLVGKQGGIVMSHMRSEDFDKIGGAIDELLQIDAHVHVSHIKIVGGHRGEEAQAVLDQLESARKRGKEVSADVYTYLASASNLEFLYPEWAKRREDYDAAVVNRRAELEAHIRTRVSERNGPEAILLLDGPYAGSTVADLARRLGKPYEKVIIDDLGFGGPAQAHFLMSAAVQDKFITADHICISTDGAPNTSHPRSVGSFAKLLEDYVGPSPKMSLERAIYKMAGLAASIVGIPNRGVLAAGNKADILVISAAGVHNKATWTKPNLAPTGFDVIIVNGEIALESGRPDSHLHGQMIKRLSTRG